MTFACGVITQALFAYDVERLVVGAIQRRGSLCYRVIIQCRGSFYTFVTYDDFLRSKRRVLKVAFVIPVSATTLSDSSFEDQYCRVGYAISIIGMTGMRIIVLRFKDSTTMEPIITRRTVPGLCVPWFDDVSDN